MDRYDDFSEFKMNLHGFSGKFTLRLLETSFQKIARSLWEIKQGSRLAFKNEKENEWNDNANDLLKCNKIKFSIQERKKKKKNFAINFSILDENLKVMLHQTIWCVEVSKDF